MADILSVLNKRYTEGGALNILGNILSTPTHLITSGFGNRSYLQNFAEGIDPSEFLPEDTPFFAKLATDLLADPLNIAFGAGAIAKGTGLITKLARGGQISKAIKKGDDIGDLLSKVTKADVDQKFFAIDKSKVGGSNIFQETLVMNQVGVRHADLLSKLRGGKLTNEMIQQAAAREKTLEGVRAADKLYGNTGVLEMEFQLQNMLKAFADDGTKAIDDLVKGRGEVFESLGAVVRAKKEAGTKLQFQKSINDRMSTLLAKYEKNMTPEQIKLWRQRVADLGGGDWVPSKWDKIVEWATMSKLWGVSTLIKNTVGNSFSAMLQIPEKFVAGSVDMITSGIRGTERSVYVREALAEATGMIGGLKEASKAFMKIMVDPDEYIKEGVKLGEILGKNRKAVGGILGEIIRGPGRVLTGTDVAFKSFLKAGNLRGLATRQALKEAKHGSDMARRVTELVEGVTDDAIKFHSKFGEKALIAAKNRIFQKDLGEFAKNLDAFRIKHPFIRLIVPFFKTPVNLFKFSLERVPVAGAFGPAMKLWKTRKSTNRFIDGMSRQEYIADMMSKQLVGGAVLLRTQLGAIEGQITGLGPKSKAKRNAMRLAGWQPQSIKGLNGDWYSYRGFEPISSWFRAAADAAEGHAEGDSVDKLVGKSMFSFLKQFSENPFLMGVNDIYKGINDPERNWADLLSGMVVGSTVPNILQQWNRTMIDPVLREPKTFPEKLAARIPVLSQTVKPRKDIFGEDIIRQVPLASFFGFNISVEQTDKTMTELSRLDMGVGKPSKTINGVELTDEEYERLYVLKGSMLKESIGKFVNYEHYERLPDEVKKKILSKAIRKVNSIARSQTFIKYYSGEKK